MVCTRLPDTRLDYIMDTSTQSTMLISRLIEDLRLIKANTLKPLMPRKRRTTKSLTERKPRTIKANTTNQPLLPRKGTKVAMLYTSLPSSIKPLPVLRKQVIK